MPTVIASGTVPALTVATYTFPRRANLRLQPEPGEQAIVKITRGPLTVFSTVLTTEQNYGPFLGGDVLEITAQRGACDYFIINPGLLLADLDAAFDSETGALSAYVNPITGEEEAFAAGGAVEVAAAQFGVTAFADDSTAGFSDLSEYIMNAAQDFGFFTENPVIQLPAGVFYVDGAKLDLTYRTTGAVTPRFTLRGAGKGVTFIIAKPDSTAAAVLEIQAGYAQNVLLEDFTVIARSDIVQDDIHILATRRSNDGTGGITELSMKRVGWNTTLGDGVVFMGGDDFLGPNQFIYIEMCTGYANAGTALRSLGQLGQVNIVNGEFAAQVLGTSAAPSMAFAQDTRVTVNASAVNTTDNFITAPVDLMDGTPVRFIGANLPSGLSTGVTYFVRRYGLADGNGNGRYSVHTTRANAQSNTRVALGSAGTLANWRICALYVSSVGAGVLIFEHPHLLVDAAVVRLDGAGFPSLLSGGTDYYVIRVDARSIRLATSKANALAGVSIAFSGGTVTTFGLSTIGVLTNEPYSVRLDNVSAQNSDCGLYLNGARDVKANLHIENCKTSIQVVNSQLCIDGGDYANAGDDGGNGVVVSVVGQNSRVTVQGAPVLTGTYNKLIDNSFGAVYPAAGGGFVNRGSSITTSQTTGILENIGAAATLDVGARDFVFVNTSATPIVSISSKLGPGSTLTILAWAGSIVFAGSGGNIRLPAGFTLPENGVAQFKSADTIGAWVLVSKTA